MPKPHLALDDAGHKTDSGHAPNSGFVLALNFASEPAIEIEAVRKSGQRFCAISSKIFYKLFRHADSISNSEHINERSC